MNDPIKTNVTANIINRMDVGSKENNGINNFDNIVKMGEKSKMTKVCLPIYNRKRGVVILLNIKSNVERQK